MLAEQWRSPERAVLCGENLAEKDSANMA